MTDELIAVKLYTEVAKESDTVSQILQTNALLGQAANVENVMKTYAEFRAGTKLAQNYSQ